MLPKLLIGTGNAGKLVEFRELLVGFEGELLCLDDLDSTRGVEVAETEDSFEANALLKARRYAQLSGLPTLAEDSGLEVTALDGAPGVHSKRFFAGSDLDRNQEILRRLQNVADRSATFIAVEALVDPETGLEKTFRGEVPLTIATEIKGDKGFGYDPIMIPEGYSQSFAELGAEVKNKVGHRARAVAKVTTFLKEYYG